MEKQQAKRKAENPKMACFYCGCEDAPENFFDSCPTCGAYICRACGSNKGEGRYELKDYRCCPDSMRNAVAMCCELLEESFEEESD